MDILNQILKQYWNYDDFRPVQREAITSVLEGKDTLLLLPTGGGKSICFQVPALASEGVCIVVTPLIALMKDQVEQLKRRHISAAAIHSGMSRQEIDIALDNCVHGSTRFLYVSPERLRTEIMIERTKRMKVCLLAVDEAHCISAWGYDFRPSYLLIADFRKLIPKVPVMALTATATEDVRVDIMTKLEMKNSQIFTQSFARANLSYSAFLEENKERKLLQILKNVSGTAIVYVRTRKKTKDLAEFLGRNGISALGYHAGLPFNDRTERQNKWIKNHVRVVVATNAFGMGIDKPDVRTVIHYELPANLEAYYQEAGRAGRDGQKAYAVALYNRMDLDELIDSVDRKYPAVSVLRRVYQALANYFKVAIGAGEFAGFSIDIQDFAGIFGLAVGETHYALKLLEEEGFIQLSENFSEPARLHFLVDNRELYDFQIRYPELDSFIKVILRIYGGELYTEYIRISTTEIAQLYFAPPDEVIRKLNFMKERGIADFEPARDKPQLTFLTPRYDAELLPLNVYEIEKRKERDSSKAQAVIQYASQSRRCRTMLLLEYFNEHNGKPCGVCDVCLKTKNDGTAELIDQELSVRLCQVIKTHGKITPKSLNELFDHIRDEIFLNTLRDLLERETVLYDHNGYLSLR